MVWLFLYSSEDPGEESCDERIDEESVRSIDEECFCFKDCSFPIALTLAYDRLEEAETNHPILRNWIYNGAIKVKKVIQLDANSGKYTMQFFGWQAKPTEEHFDLSRFDDYKANLKKLVDEKNLPDYFKTDKGTVTQTSYRDGVKQHIEKGLAAMGEPGWVPNPGGYKEVFGSLLPRFYLVHG